MLNFANKPLCCVSLCIMPHGGHPYYDLYYEQITIIIMTFYKCNLQLYESKLLQLQQRLHLYLYFYRESPHIFTAVNYTRKS